MKKIKPMITLSLLLLFLAGCNQSIEKASRTISLIQENVTSIINSLQEIQNLENQIQQTFEESLESSDDLAVFEKNDLPIFDNTTARGDYLQKLTTQEEQLMKFVEEIKNQREGEGVATQQMDQLASDLEALRNDLNVYTTDYKENLQLEIQAYHSLANPENDFYSFFKIFDNAQILTINNSMNLEKVLPHFETINSQLINLKVTLTNLEEERK